MTSIKPTISTTEHPVQLALNIIESKDMNYVSMLENATHTSPRLINPFDVAAAREWVEQVALKQDRCPPASIRKRNLPDMDINTISVTYGSDEEFSVRVYNPTPPNGHGPDKNDSHRAALIMFHGGGWTHGCPKIDEGSVSTLDCSATDCKLMKCRFGHILFLGTSSSRSKCRLQACARAQISYPKR